LVELSAYPKNVMASLTGEPSPVPKLTAAKTAKAHLAIQVGFSGNAGITGYWKKERA
jgi:hypothetical protein